MGSADIVPGVSGGTVALVLGIYERLIHNVHQGATALKELLRGRRADCVIAVKQVEWVWLLSLLAGIFAAIALLASVIVGLVHDHPLPVSGLFFGLVAASLVVAWHLIRHIDASQIGIMVAVAAILFFLLGLRSDTEVADDAAEIVTEPLWKFFLAGALAICAMILPGISGSFILVMIGMYTEVLGAVNDRDFGALAATALGCIVGLALFSTLLNWLLERHHDMVMAAMVGLMIGSLRVLWPWPDGTNTTDLAWPSDVVVAPILLAVVGFAVVIGVDAIARRSDAATT
jgi:putative membrane protein